MWTQRRPGPGTATIGAQLFPVTASAPSTPAAWVHPRVMALVVVGVAHIAMAEASGRGGNDRVHEPAAGDGLSRPPARARARTGDLPSAVHLKFVGDKALLGVPGAEAERGMRPRRTTGKIVDRELAIGE
ncbi:MAG: hypothetical protein ABW022_06575 [Actinoplanes sp.]